VRPAWCHLLAYPCADSHAAYISIDVRMHTAHENGPTPSGASLEKMLRVEEEKRQVIVRVRDHTGPRVRTKSVREGDSVRVSCASGRHSFFELEQTTKSIASNSSPHSLFITPPRPFSRPPPANACASSSSLCHCNRQLELCPIPPPSGVLCADIRDIHRSSTSSVDGRRGAPLPATCEVRCNRTNRQVL